jgi:hypothetical protein
MHALSRNDACGNVITSSSVVPSAHTGNVLAAVAPAVALAVACVRACGGDARWVPSTGVHAQCDAAGAASFYMILCITLQSGTVSVLAGEALS